MNAQTKDRELSDAITRHALHLGQPVAGTVQIARTLRRAQLTLHRWSEEMCNGTIQRDGEDGDGKPFRYWDPGQRFKTPVPDRERGALARVEQVCKAAGLYWYHQTDPRGCALYVGAVPLTDQNYSTAGVACL